MLEYGEHEGCGVNLQLFSALVGVALSDQQREGAGQIGVLVSSPKLHCAATGRRVLTSCGVRPAAQRGAHLPLADFYTTQRAHGGPVGPGGPFWEREDFNAPNGHGVRHYPDFVREQFSEGAEYSRDGKMWPRPTFMKLRPGDAVLILGHTPHAISRCTMDQPHPRLQCYFRATACWRDKGGDPEHTGKLLDTCCDPWLDWPVVGEFARKHEAKAPRRPAATFSGQARL